MDAGTVVLQASSEKKMTLIPLPFGALRSAMGVLETRRPVARAARMADFMLMLSW